MKRADLYAMKSELMGMLKYAHNDGLAEEWFHYDIRMATEAIDEAESRLPPLGIGSFEDCLPLNYWELPG
jgi:hypothetical protein